MAERDDALGELEAGGVLPALRWALLSAEVQADRLRAENALQRVTGTERMIRAQIRTLVDQLVGIMETLYGADPYGRAAVYAQLGLRLTYKPAERVVQAEASPGGPGVKDRVRGGS